MSDVDFALHPWAARNIDRHQITENQTSTLVVERQFAFLRFVNVGRFVAVHQHGQATDKVPANEGLASRGAGQEQ
ncbi:hypothetical protein OVA07_14695 [Novosphingobium sp. SL115]|uniref:hypothetical protein n=1 Tax=Novosphingobium sp. SL115 TaxID=2995150 RepID=UPI002272925B|nr:hypothetical protein [Novosphingobium sp. SL115]MCY1672252.1 hypothetical protein [Novosphingobium sp. SL115]